MASDPRLDAFLYNRTEVFEPVEHRHEIWKDDPFDVPSVHKDARDEFELLLNRIHCSISGLGSRPGSVQVISGCIAVLV